MALVSSDQFALYRPTDSHNYKTSLDDITSFIQATTASNLQEVTDNGSNTTNTILINKSDSASNALTIQNAGTQTAAILGSGSATFAHSVSSEYFQANRDDSTYKLWIGQLNGANTSTIVADGSATFLSDVGVGPNYTSATNNASGIWLGSSGRTTLYHSNTESNPFITCVQNDGAGGSNTLVVINGNGSVTVAGAATIAGAVISTQAGGDYSYKLVNPSDITSNAGGLYQDGVGSSQLYLKPAWGSPQTILLDGATGGGTFDGTIQVAGNPVDGAATGVQVRSSGDVRASSASGTAKLWQGYTTGSVTGTSWITADGSAIFAKYACAGTWGGTAAGAWLWNNGGVYSVSGTSDGIVWRGGPASGSFVQSSEILANGNATFGGTLSAGTIANTVPLDSWSAIPVLT